MSDAPAFPDTMVDYGAVIPLKLNMLRRSFERFTTAATPGQRQSFANFGARNHIWLNDYALFAALKQANGGAAWITWEPAIRRREPDAVAHWSHELYDQLQFHAYLQFQFFSRW